MLRERRCKLHKIAKMRIIGKVALQHIASGRVRTHDYGRFFRFETVADRFFLLLVAWPYFLTSQIVDIALFIVVSAIGLTMGQRVSGQLIIAFVIFSSVFLCQAVISGLGDFRLEYIMSQSNSYLQVICLLPGICFLISRSNWIDILSSRKLTLALALISSASFIYQQIFLGHTYEYDINSLALFACVLLNRDRFKTFALFAGVGILVFGFALFTRAGLLFVLAGFAFISLRPLPATLVRIVALFTIVIPVVVSLMLDDKAVFGLITYDFNSAIRIQFLKSAMPYFIDHPWFGVGFGDYWRDPTAFRAFDHPLLSNPQRLLLVSNHHSIFDVAYRLGVFAAGAIIYIGIIAPKFDDVDRVKALYMLALAQGLGVNAWLENQNQVLQAIFIMAFLNFARSERKSTPISIV